MKVTFEIDRNLLKAAAGIGGIQHPEIMDEMMAIASNIQDEEIFVTKSHLDDMAKVDKHYNQIPILVAMVALSTKFLEDDDLN